MENEKVLSITPSPKQREFFLSEAKYTAYGGARGGGKSYALRGKLALLCLRYPGIRALLVRRSYPELRENHIRPLCAMLCGEPTLATFCERDKCFLFTNGSLLKLGYLAGYDDLLQYQGQEFDVIAIDEATQIEEQMFQTLSASLRGVNDFPKRMYLTCNPGGVGHGYVKRLFLDREFRRGETPEDYRFIAASVYDNEALMREDPDYVRRLEALPDDLRAAWLYGDWNVFSGQFFPEFRADKHVCPPVAIPPEATRYCAIDYGLDMLAALFIAVCPDGRAYVYDEIYEKDQIVSAAAAKVRAKLPEDATVIAPADLWSRNRDSGRTTADLFAEGGVYLTKLAPDRVGGWLALKEWLADEDGVPRLRIFPTCRNLIRCLPQLTCDEDHPGDAATMPHEITHAPDALRYFASFRVAAPTGTARPRGYFGRRAQDKFTYEKGEIQIGI